MKIVKFWGGLGNQMFQFAFFKRIQKEYSAEQVLVDVTAYETYNLHNGLELENVFAIDLPKASKDEMLKVTRYFQNYKFSRAVRKFFPKKKTEYIEEKDFVYFEDCFSLKSDFFFEGYWQNQLYFDQFEEEIRECFKFKNELDSDNLNILADIEASESVCVHIRRGDYLKHKLYKNICELSYYKKAISYMSSKLENPKYFVFSNDVEWCKENLGTVFGNAEFVFVTNNKGKNSYKDLQLMSNCKHNIIANSSFSWWGAWLNKNANKIIVAPEKWINRSGIGKIQLDSWVLI